MYYLLYLIIFATILKFSFEILQLISPIQQPFSLAVYFNHSQFLPFPSSYRSFCTFLTFSPYFTFLPFFNTKIKPISVQVIQENFLLSHPKFYLEQSNFFILCAFLFINNSIQLTYPNSLALHFYLYFFKRSLSNRIKEFLPWPSLFIINFFHLIHFLFKKLNPLIKIFDFLSWSFQIPFFIS